MAEEAKQAEEQQPKKGGKKLLIIIAAAVVVLGGGGAAAMFLLGGSPPAAAEAEEEAGAAQEKAELVTLDSFVVNLADPKGDRFMKATLRAVVTDPTINQQLVDDNLLRARVRDRVLSVLSSKQFKDLNTPLGKEALRRELTQELSQFFPPGTVKEVLFVEFVIQ